MTKRSQYLIGHEHEGQHDSRGSIRPGGQKYIFIYPFWKTRAWYLLPPEERQRLMNEHIRVGHLYPRVKLNTTYSFGIDDQEFVVAFETNYPGRLSRPGAAVAGDRDQPLHAERHAHLHLHSHDGRRYAGAAWLAADEGQASKAAVKKPTKAAVKQRQRSRGAIRWRRSALRRCWSAWPRPIPTPSAPCITATPGSFWWPPSFRRNVPTRA